MISFCLESVGIPNVKSKLPVEDWYPGIPSWPAFPCTQQTIFLKHTINRCLGGNVLKFKGAHARDFLTRILYTK